MIVLWAWIGAVVVALVIFGIVGYDLVGRLRRLQRAVAAMRAERLPRARALIEGVQLQRSSGRHSVERLGGRLPAGDDPAAGPADSPADIGDGHGSGGVASAAVPASVSASVSASPAGED